MKRIFLSFLTVALSIIGTQASDTQWSYTISTPYGGRIVTTEENGTLVTQNYANTELYTLKTNTEGIRFTVVETNIDRKTNGYYYFVLGEFRVLDANGNPVAYTATSNADYNEFNGKDGDGLPALNDGVLNNYFHSNYGSGAPDAYHYIELTFEEPISAFSLEWYGRPNNSNYEFSPTLSGITPKGYEFTEDMINYGNQVGEDDENKDILDEITIYNTVDVFTEPCLFVSLANGGVDAYALNTLAKEQYNKNDTLYVPLASGSTIKYHTSEYTKISNEVPQLPYLTSYKFNNKYNANLNVDVIADCSNENIEVSLNSIDKSLAASFQMSEERAVAYIGNKLQTSKETRNRFDEPIKYTITYPGYNIIQDVKAQDTIYKDVRVPFGRIYTITPKWLTDNGAVPRIDIDMNHSASSITKETYLDAKISISGFGVYDDFVDSVQIKGRGNSTWGYSKKPYRLKFASKVKPFGLTKGKSWVLLANAQRGALMANAIAMKVGQLANVPYTNHIIPVELYINGEYKGSYMFTEHLGLSNNSVDEDEDLGYMLELDSYYDEDFKFRSSYYNLPVNVKDPDLLDYNEEERNAKFDIIQSDFAKFEEALYRNNGELGKYLDLDAAARFILVNELVLNKELCHPKSTYLWKGDMYSSESKIVFGPLWDFDWAFGYENTKSYFDIDYKTKLLSMSGDGKNFFQALMTNEEFLKHYYKVWKEFTKAGHIEEIKNYISDYYSFVETSFENNYNLWGDGNAYGSKITTMQNWMQNRHDYIASTIRKYDITDIIHTLLGDIDCNDLLTIRDVALLVDYLNGTTGEDFNNKKADTDNNGNIDLTDLSMTVKLLANGEPVPSMYHYNTPVSKATLTAIDGTTNGNIINIPVYLQNNKQEEIKAIQADIVVPSDIYIEKISARNRANGDTVVYAQITNELYRIVAYNKNGSPFVCEDALFNIELNNSNYTAAETGMAQIKDILVADSSKFEKRINDTQFAINESGKHSIIYIVDGEIYKIVALEDGKNITLIEEPVKSGYTFSGWSETPETMPEANITVNGTFTANSYKIIYKVDGVVYDSVTVAYGSKITLIEEPVKSGYIFSGWSETPETMPANDIVIEGTFEQSLIIGDANMDNIVTVTDIVTVVNYILMQEPKVFNFEAADINGDKEITISDIVAIVNIILKSGIENTNSINAKCSATTHTDNRLTMSDIQGEAGIVSIPVSMDNNIAYTAMQMDIELPEGVTFVSASLSERATDKHSITWQSISENKVRVVAYSVTNATFTGNTGELVILDVETADGANGIVAVDNVRMATAEGIENAIGGCGAAIEINGTTNIASVDDTEVIVKVDGNSITLTGADNSSVSIYSTGGALIKGINNYSGEEITLDNGVYIVRTKNKTIKIKL